MQASWRRWLCLIRDGALNALFPATERARRIERHAESPLCAAPETRRVGSRAVTFLAPYEGRVREHVCALKFERNTRAAEMLALMLDDFLGESLAERGLFGGAAPLAVPVPLGIERLRERGFNQIDEVLAHATAVRSKQLQIAHALVRTRNTNMQSTLPRRERLINMQGAFAIAPPWNQRLAGRHVLLIDDVTTTGATLSEAALPLEEAGATVECLALAG